MEINKYYLQKKTGEFFKDARAQYWKPPVYTLSQDKLSQKTGIRRATISGVENGKILPKLDTLVNLLAGLELSLSDFAEYLEK